MRSNIITLDTSCLVNLSHF